MKKLPQNKPSSRATRGKPLRLIWLGLVLVAFFAIPFLFWGRTFTAWLSGDAAVRWLRGWGPFGWLAVIGLLISDLFLPIPTTAVMSAGGYLYGIFVGGAVGAAGSFLSGLLAYGLCFRFGRTAAERLVDSKGLTAGERLFRRRGAWLVALSRCLPLLAEIVACLAGLTRMPWRFFALSSACGCLPLGFVYAAIGASGQDHPAVALGLSMAVPAALWAFVHLWLRWTGRAACFEPSSEESAAFFGRRQGRPDAK